MDTLQGAPAQETLYDLYGVVCHMGSSFFGHYISYAELVGSGLGWRCFDDSRVSGCSAAAAAPAQKEAAYLLFYRRRDLAPGALLGPYEARLPDVPAALASFAPKLKGLLAEEEEEGDTGVTSGCAPRPDDDEEMGLV